MFLEKANLIFQIWTSRIYLLSHERRHALLKKGNSESCFCFFGVFCRMRVRYIFSVVKIYSHVKKSQWLCKLHSLVGGWPGRNSGETAAWFYTCILTDYFWHSIERRHKAVVRWPTWLHQVICIPTQWLHSISLFA